MHCPGATVLPVAKLSYPIHCVPIGAHEEPSVSLCIEISMFAGLFTFSSAVLTVMGVLPSLRSTMRLVSGINWLP